MKMGESFRNKIGKVSAISRDLTQKRLLECPLNVIQESASLMKHVESFCVKCITIQSKKISPLEAMKRTLFIVNN